MPCDTGNKIGLHLVNGIAGNERLPGAPTLSFSLTVNAASGKVTGQATQKQSLAPPFDEICIHDITGDVHVRPKDLQFVSLKGTALISLGSPPLVGEYISPFRAFLADSSKHWNGHGSWTIGKNQVKNVPVREKTVVVVDVETNDSLITPT